MASMNYTSFALDLFKGNIDTDVDTFKMMLTTNAYVPAKTHTKRSDITNEVVGTGYTAGGAVVTLTPTQDNANSRIVLTPSNPSWATATITARYGVIYKARGGAATADELVGVVDFGSDVASTAATFSATVTTPLYLNN